MVTTIEPYKTKNEAIDYAKFVRKEHPIGKVIKGSKIESVSVIKLEKGYGVEIVWRHGLIKKKAASRTTKKARFGIFGA